MFATPGSVEAVTCKKKTQPHSRDIHPHSLGISGRMIQKGIHTIKAAFMSRCEIDFGTIAVRVFTILLMGIYSA